MKILPTFFVIVLFVGSSFIGVGCSEGEKDGGVVGDEMSGAIIDIDNDGIEEGYDNCELIANPGQEDADGDGVGDVCDSCPDADGYSNEDGCPDDADADGVPDIIDNCPSLANPDQVDDNYNGMGDACETADCTYEEFEGTCEITKHDPGWFSYFTFNGTIDEESVAFSWNETWSQARAIGETFDCVIKIRTTGYCEFLCNLFSREDPESSLGPGCGTEAEDFVESYVGE